MRMKTAIAGTSSVEPVMRSLKIRDLKRWSPRAPSTSWFSRTATLWEDFADAFEGADVLAVTDIYSAGEPPRPGITGKLIVNTVLDAHPLQRTAWLPHRSDVVTFLRAELRPGDLCLTMGAGDLTTLPDVMLEVLS